MGTLRYLLSPLGPVPPSSAAMSSQASSLSQASCPYESLVGVGPVLKQCANLCRTYQSKAKCLAAIFGWPVRCANTAMNMLWNELMMLFYSAASSAR
jgi:hypothetical protein